MRNVFLTGGAGFLGRTFIRHCQAEMPDVRLTVYSRDEAKHERARRLFPQCCFVLGDVRDYDRLELAMAGHDTVIHMAAMKYVPEGETNVAEAVAVNIEGSKNVGKAAIRNNVARVVGISTDKACQPINIYGMTKLIMERLFQEYDRISGTRFNLVRYGNVVASTGSVVPLLRQQLKEIGMLRITDPAMTRFWLPVETAIKLVVRCLEEPQGGTVLIPRVPSCTMRTLAEAILLLEGYDRVDGRIEIIGGRFGEKQCESLLGIHESPFAEWLDEEVDGWKLIRLYPAWRKPDKTLVREYHSAEADVLLPREKMVAWIKGTPE